MTAYLLDHKTKARLHNILADAYNYQTRRFSLPDANELMALMKVLSDIPALPQSFQAVNIRTELPPDSGWYNIIGDCSPYACGRVWFDGTKFDWGSAATSFADLLNNNTHIYWLKRIRETEGV